MSSGKPRLRPVAAHTAPSPPQVTQKVLSEDRQEPLPEALVGFSGGAFLPVEPLSPDAHGGPGRRAWQRNQDGRRDVFQVDHQILRRQAETGSLPLWRIHGKLYDLKPFMDLHPGGRIWLELTCGTDATAAFEAYHLDGPRVEAVLAKYYVRDVQNGEFKHGDRYSFADDGFFRTLRRRVLEKLTTTAGRGSSTRTATAATPSMKIACALAVAQAGVLHAMARISGSFLATALAGAALCGCWGVGHNFMHQAQSKAGLWPYAMDLTGIAHVADWRISHALAHHLDTNLETDWEYSNFFDPYTEQADWKKLIIIPSFGIALQLQSLQYTVNTVRHLLNGDARTVGKHWGHVLPGFLPFLQLASYIRGRRSIRSGTLLYLVQSMAFFMLFSPLSAGVHHAAPAPESEESGKLRSEPRPRNTLCWMEHQAGAQSDFGAHQVTATTDHTVFPKTMPAVLRDWLSLTLFGYLNNHTLHHIFPAVDASHLHEVRDVLEETAKEFGLDPKDVQTYSWQSIYKGYFRYTAGRQVRSRL